MPSSLGGVLDGVDPRRRTDGVAFRCASTMDQRALLCTSTERDGDEAALSLLSMRIESMRITRLGEGRALGKTLLHMRAANTGRIQPAAEFLITRGSNAKETAVGKLA